MEKREEVKPESVRCPEGVWICDAFLSLAEKNYRDEYNDKNVGLFANDLINALLINPDIEIFFIDSFSGEKESFDRSFLRSQRAVTAILLGYIPYSSTLSHSRVKENGRYIFINRVHFERFLKDEPVIQPKALEHIPAVAKNDVLPEYVPPYLAFMNLAVWSTPILESVF